jgi:hypothetical protein
VYWGQKGIIKVFLHPLGTKINFPKGRKIALLTILFKDSFQKLSFVGYPS